MEDNDDYVKQYAIYFIFVAVLTMITIKLMRATTETETGLMILALLATLAIFMKIVLGLNVPSLPKVTKEKK